MSEILAPTDTEAAVATLVKPEKDDRKGDKRDLLPYRLIDTITFVVGEATSNDERLERCVAIVETWIKERRISKNVGNDLTVLLMAAGRDNDHIKDVLLMLRDSGMPSAQEEVSRVKAVRRKIASDSKDGSK